MKPNNLFFVPCTEDSFYRVWLELLTPYHKLTAREKDVAARILQQYFKFKDSVASPDVLKELLWSRKSRRDIMDSLKMSQAQFQMILAKLKSVGFITEGNIEVRYIPHKVPGESRLIMQACFDWSSSVNPIHNEKG